jgi:RNA polymerase sigma-70 factor, ECF subfamily
MKGGAASNLLFAMGASLAEATAPRRQHPRFATEPFGGRAHYTERMPLRSGHLFLVPAAPMAEAEGPPHDRRTDDELMLLARGGVEEAFDVLVRRHQARVLRMAGRLLGRGALAPDVAQNAFLEIYRGLDRYQPQGKFSAYLFRVLLNQCRTAARSARRAGVLVGDLPATSGDRSGESLILAREREREVEAALRRLSEKLRTVVVLRHSAGLSYDEIAETLDLPLGTVKRRLFDAMEKLRRMLEDP